MVPAVIACLLAVLSAAVAEVSTTPDPPSAEANLSIDPAGNETTFLSYGRVALHHSQGQSNCTITVKDSIRGTVRRFTCNKPRGEILTTNLEKGRLYNVSYDICNTVGCSSSAGFQEWTHPGTPIPSDNISQLNSNTTYMSLRIPKFGGGSLPGRSYLLVLPDCGEPVAWTKEDAQDVVLRNNGSGSRAASPSCDGGHGPQNVLWISPLKKDVDRFNLSAHVLDNVTGAKGVFVCCVRVLQAGRHQSFAWTGWGGPFGFRRGEPPPAPAWLAGLGVALIALIFATGLALGLGARKNKVQTKNQNNCCDYSSITPEDLESASRAPSSSIYQELPPASQPSMAYENQVFDCHLPKFSYLEDNFENPPLECDYTHSEPNKSSQNELDNYLIEASHSHSLKLEFMAVPTVLPGRPTNEGNKPQNRDKNRYQNNLPYDDTRVILANLPEDDFANYINANMIQTNVGTCGQKVTYIATQGPLDQTISDFWRMVWYKNVDSIVMLANIIEHGQMKCSQYWPNEGTEIMYQDKISVLAEGTENKTSFLIRSFVVTRGPETRKVYHYHFTQWPDFGIPIVVSPLAHMMTLIRANHRYGPTIVHCSAGLGRTGCVLMVMLCLEDIAMSRPVNMKDNLRRLRNGRSNLIQNITQYKFCHYLLWVILFERTKTLTLSEFLFQCRNVQEGASQNEDQTPTLAAEFKKLKSYTNDLTYTVAMNKKIHRKYNRFPSTLPADSRRVELLNTRGKIEDQYLNAVWIDGYDKQDAYVVAEAPLAATLGRAWLMVLQRKIQFWVLLNQNKKNEGPTIIPERSSTVSNSLVKVEWLAMEIHAHFDETRVRIYDKADPSNCWECVAVQLHGWHHPDPSPLLGPDGLFDLLDHLHAGTPSASPLLFTCFDGFTACGLTLALDLCLQRIRAQREVNVFAHCVSITYSRPQFIVSFDQYKTIYDSISSFLLKQEQDINTDVEVFEKPE